MQYRKISKWFVFISIALLNSNCSFIIGGQYDSIKSTHIPSIPLSGIVFNTLRGTVWKSQGNNMQVDVYLFVSQTNSMYTTEQMRDSVIPIQYPPYYQYTSLGVIQSLSGSSLKDNQVTIFRLENNPNHYIGFYLKDNTLLITAEETGGYTSIISSFENDQGIKWDLYI